MFTMMMRKRSFVFASLLLTASPAVSAAAAPQAEDAERRLSLQDEELLLRLEQQLAEAIEIFEDQQRQSQSIDFLSAIIDEIEDVRRARDETPQELLDVQQEALELRARAFFNAGQLQGAADDFRQLLLENPRYALDTESLSPRIVDFFEDQKKQLIGYIAVTTEPAGARVMVDDEFIGITNFFPIEVHTGLARLEVTLEGYAGYVDENLRIEPGEITTLDLVLDRTSASLPIITDPPGVEILVDGEVVGETSGTLPPDLRSFMPAQFDPARLSAPFELSALPLGRHEIELRLDCYETVRFPFVAEEPRDYTAQIVKLSESVGRVTVTSTPSNASVFLDGELQGTTPLDLARVCSGEHRLEVKHATGKYVEDIRVGADESLSFECPIRPTLAMLGLVHDDDVPARDVADIRETLETGLRSLSAMNVVFPPHDEIEAILGTAGLSAFLPASPQAKAPDVVRELTERLGRDLEVEALLVGFIPRQRLTKDVVLHLLAVGSSKPDRYALNYLDRNAVPAFVDNLSAPTEIFGSWIGLTSVDTRLTAGPVVIAVEEGGPAAEGGFAVGDVVVSVGGNEVTRALDVLEAVRASEPGARLSLSVIRNGASREIDVTVGRTPLEIPMNDEDFLYNKAIVDLRHRMVVDPSVENLAKLNIGLAYMQLGDYETALKEYLPDVTLPETGGISQGTVYYYTALAYLRVGERDEAARLFEQALGYEDATLQSNDGPRVAPLAQRRLREAGRPGQPGR